MSSLIFRSSDGYYSVWSCRCGCDGLVKVTGIMEHECGSSLYFYIRGHQAVGTGYEHIGARYEFVPEALKTIGRNSSPVEKTSEEPATLPPSTDENAVDALPGALDDMFIDIQHCTDWPDDEKTPTVHLAWWQWPGDDGTEA